MARMADRARRLLAGTVLLLLLVEVAASDTLKYTYDALGRITFVEDPANGNRDYDYDAAGNRVLVSVGGNNDAANDPATAAPSVPSALSNPATNASGTYPVSWGEAAGHITSYELWEANNPSFSGETRVFNGLALGYTLTGRIDGTYYYRVRACNGSACGPHLAGTGGTRVLLLPGVPGTMSIPTLAVPPNAYLVSWGTPGGSIARYEIEQHSNASFTALVSSWQRTPPQTSVEPTASTEGTFYFRVRACNDSGCSAFRNGDNSVLVLRPPVTPTGLGTQLISFCTWRATWNTVSSATSYKVTDTHGAVTTTTSPVASILWSTTCPPPAGVSPDSNKPAFVQACNAAGCSANAAFDGQTTPPPEPPSSINYPTSSSSGSYTVSWGSSPSIVTTYELYEATNVSFSGASRIYNDSGFSIALSRGDGTYYYRVRACNGANCSIYTTGNGIVVTFPPGAPGGITFPSTPVANTNYTISWGTASGTVARYEVEAHSNPSFTALVQSWNTTTNTASWTPTTPGTFYFRLRACNISGCSGYTNGGSVTVAGPPAVPTGLSAVTISFCSWRATWNAVPDATSYRVTDTRGSVQTTSATQATVLWSSTCPPPAGVNPNSNKPATVQACNSAGCSANASF
jgi:YD repeat-containing protein